MTGIGKLRVRGLVAAAALAALVTALSGPTQAVAAAAGSAPTVRVRLTLAGAPTRAVTTGTRVPLVARVRPARSAGIGARRPVALQSRVGTRTWHTSRRAKTGRTGVARFAVAARTGVVRYRVAAPAYRHARPIVSRTVIVTGRPRGGGGAGGGRPGGGKPGGGPDGAGTIAGLRGDLLYYLGIDGLVAAEIDGSATRLLAPYGRYAEASVSSDGKVVASVPPGDGAWWELVTFTVADPTPHLLATAPPEFCLGLPAWTRDNRHATFSEFLPDAADPHWCSVTMGGHDNVIDTVTGRKVRMLIEEGKSVWATYSSDATGRILESDLDGPVLLDPDTLAATPVPRRGIDASTGEFASTGVEDAVLTPGGDLVVSTFTLDLTPGSWAGRWDHWLLPGRDLTAAPTHLVTVAHCAGNLLPQGWPLGPPATSPGGAIGWLEYSTPGDCSSPATLRVTAPGATTGRTVVTLPTREPGTHTRFRWLGDGHLLVLTHTGAGTIYDAATGAAERVVDDIAADIAGATPAR